MTSSQKRVRSEAPLGAETAARFVAAFQEFWRAPARWPRLLRSGVLGSALRSFGPRGPRPADYVG